MSPTTPAGGSVVAAFDVDGTLTRADCVRPFLERLAGRRALASVLLRRFAPMVKALARRDRDDLKEIVVGGVFRGRFVSEVAAVGGAFAAHVEAKMLRPDTLARLRWHQSSGHSVVLVSASLRPYLDPLAASLGLEGVLCADVERDGDRYLDTLVGGNCRGPEKARRLAAWLAANDLTDADIWAYGDSSGDRELLAMAHHPVWVGGTTLTPVPDETTT